MACTPSSANEPSRAKPSQLGNQTHQQASLLLSGQTSALRSVELSMSGCVTHAESDWLPCAFVGGFRRRKSSANHTQPVHIQANWSRAKQRRARRVHTSTRARRALPLGRRRFAGRIRRHVRRGRLSSRFRFRPNPRAADRATWPRRLQPGQASERRPNRRWCRVDLTRQSDTRATGDSATQHKSHASTMSHSSRSAPPEARSRPTARNQFVRGARFGFGLDFRVCGRADFRSSVCARKPH